MFQFTVTKKLHRARLSTLRTPHGIIEGPFFQFVATRAGIRGQVYAEDLEKIGAQIVLANTYHLQLRPGADLIAAAGGLHNFMQWPGPITTDSGGYQVFSLGDHVQLDSDGVTFRSPLDGRTHRLTPETTIQIEAKLGADLIMPLDVCTPFGASHDEVAAAVHQTYEWAKRCREEYERLRTDTLLAQKSLGVGVAPLPRRGAPSSRSSGPALPAGGWRGPIPDGLRETPRDPGQAVLHHQQALYGIVQGGVYADLRERAASQIRELGFFGYAIGGELREGQAKRLAEVVTMTAPQLPSDAPRYLMGYGRPEDIIEAVRLGIDQFDCVLPVRNARHGQLYYDLNEAELRRCLTEPDRPVDGKALYTVIDITKSVFAQDFSLVSPNHPVIARPYTKAYVHHLLRAEPPSGMRLAVLHNIYFYSQFMRAIRQAIRYT